MMKRVLTFLILLNSFNFWGQQEVTLTVAVDSTAIKIGSKHISWCINNEILNELYQWD